MAKNRPVGVTILAVLAYIGAAFTLIGGLALLFGSAALSAFIATWVPKAALFATAGTALFIFLGLIMIAFAVLDYFIGKGLWNGQNWARIVVLVLAVLSFISSIFPFNIVGLVIDGVIIWYLGFNKEAVKYFK